MKGNKENEEIIRERDQTEVTEQSGVTIDEIMYPSTAQSLATETLTQSLTIAHFLAAAVLPPPEKTPLVRFKLDETGAEKPLTGSSAPVKR